MNSRLSNVDFTGQFRLSREPERARHAWYTERLRDWTLQYCPSLRMTYIYDRDERKVGCVLGFAMDNGGRLLGKRLALDYSMDNGLFSDQIEQSITNLAGRYVGIIVTGDVQKVYLDPGGQLSVVYNSEHEVAGSSLYVVSDYMEPAGELVDLIGVPKKDDAYYPFGMTPNSNVRRVLPNHYLDLTRFVADRHWPVQGEITTRSSGDVGPLVSRIGEKLQRNITAILSDCPACIALTAGRDSRMLLAATRHNLARVHFFTINAPDRSASLDCRIAAALARDFNLQHRILQWEEATREELEAWQLRGGYSGGGRTWRAVRTRLQLDTERVHILGLCGEVGRTYYWHEKDLDASHISPEELLLKLSLPDHPVLVNEADTWMRGLPLSNRLDILDFLYIEQRLGCWAGPNHYGHVKNSRVVVPLCDREIFGLMLQLPAEYRFQQDLAPDFIKLHWPELLTVPFNKDTATREALKLLKNRARSFLRSWPTLWKYAFALRRHFRRWRPRTPR